MHKRRLTIYWLLILCYLLKMFSFFLVFFLPASSPALHTQNGNMNKKQTLKYKTYALKQTLVLGNNKKNILDNIHNRLSIANIKCVNTVQLQNEHTARVCVFYQIPRWHKILVQSVICCPYYLTLFDIKQIFKTYTKTIHTYPDTKYMIISKAPCRALRVVKSIQYGCDFLSCTFARVLFALK